MFETYLTVIGNVITEPHVRNTNSGDVVNFRVAGNSRRRDPDSKEWVNGPTLYLTVTCWRNLAAAVGDSLRRGSPIIAHGRVSTDEYVAGDGSRRSDLVMSADAVGIDLARSSRSQRAATVDTAEVPVPAGSFAAPAPGGQVMPADPFPATAASGAGTAA